ncbi:MAG: efflux RND transporter periplasmic adaptor subunit [Thermoanaerobaculia bacterium]|nr:efflux RND transporter periplasmic adaptor subunit [Thermoanaerobaculia bacterium]
MTMAMAMAMPDTLADNRKHRSAPHLCWLAAAAFLGVGCAGEAPEVEPTDHAHGSAGSWSVTAWGRLYEVFPESEVLEAGVLSLAHVHVTVLSAFSPLEAGRVEVVLTSPNGREEAFPAAAPSRPGIFDIEMTPESAGDFDLLFRISSAAGDETIRGGNIRVGGHGSAGKMLRAPAPRGATAGGEPISFLKEQQWQARFETDWVRNGTFSHAVEGLAEVRPVAGGETWLTAPVDGLIEARPWPYVGQDLRAGEVLFRLAPSVSPSRSLAELKADVDAAHQERDSAVQRLTRLDELFQVEASSLRELEEARTRATIAETRFAAAEQDLAAARAARQGRGGGAPLLIEAPFAGQLAAVTATPGSAVGAGDRLTQLVRTDVSWLKVAIAPHTSSLLTEGVSGVVLAATTRSDSTLESALRFDREATHLISVAPRVDSSTGKLDVLIEIPGSVVPLGSTWNAQILLAAQDEGVVLPTSALVDDGGEMVVYLQLGGETFVRQPVDVVSRQGEQALVNGLVPGQRLVTRGGESIRRASLISSGAEHGHIH